MAAFNAIDLRGSINGAQDLKQLKNYIFMLVESLEYTLNNLDEENLSTAYNQKSGLSAAEAANVAKQAAAEAQALAVQIGKIAVPSTRIINAINESTETIPIKGIKILTTAVEGNITLVGRDANGNLVPCKAEITGDATNGFTLVISATE